MSRKRSQNETFRDFMGEIGNLLYEERDIDSLLDRIQESYESDEISPSQYDKLKREFDENI